jgi:hypothetical protein
MTNDDIPVWGKICDCASPPNRLPEPSPEERALRRDLALLQTRDDCGSVSPAVQAAIRKIEIELAWLEHRGRA